MVRIPVITILTNMFADKDLQTNHIPFPKISQFSNVVYQVRQLYKDQTVLPILQYYGRVKLHGTNSSIVFLSDGSFYCQSRTRVIKVGDDNDGFAAYVGQNIDRIRHALDMVAAPDLTTVFYGEWCGGNIQSGVAINQLPKMFVVFAIARLMPLRIQYQYRNLDLIIDPMINLYNTALFGTWDVEIDFNQPHLAQNKLVEFTQQVEACCPVGKYFGVDGIGEGLVFLNSINNSELEIFSFKSKGEEHSKSPVKTIGVVDVVKLAEIDKLVEYLLYHNQLEDRPTQAIRMLKEAGYSMTSMTDMKVYIDWVKADIMSENLPEIEESGLTIKEVMSSCTNRAKTDYKLYLDKLAGLII
jgi:hypothetical protein